MKGKTALLAVGLLACAGLAIYLLVASGSEGVTPEATAGAGTGSAGSEPGSAGPSRTPEHDPTPNRIVRPPDPRRDPVATGHDAGAADSIAVPRNPDKKESLPEKLAAHARQRQVAMLRVELASLKERVGKLTATIARLKKEGSATPLQLQQIQRQLQQSIDAQPRVQGQLEKAEQEQREAEKKKLEEKPEAKPEAK